MKTNIIILITMITILLISENAIAKDFGVIGETYPIIEMNFMEFITFRAQAAQTNGQWQNLQKQMQREANNYRDRPKPVLGITKTLEDKSWLFDPTIVLDRNLTTPDGKLIAFGGTKINPLHSISLTKTLIFYDGDDESQVHWALELDKKLKGKDKLILVNGSILQQEKKFKKTVYFDQSGKLSARFKIEHVPATVNQELDKLIIKEIRI